MSEPNEVERTAELERGLPSASAGAAEPRFAAAVGSAQRPVGEVDMGVADGMVAAALERLANVGAVLVIDLLAVSFIDSIGLSAFVRIRNGAIARGKSVIATNPQPNVARTFELTGLANAFGLAPSTSAAL